MSSEKKASSSEVTRRSFLQTGSTVAAGLAWTAQSYGSILGANDRIRIGFIGAGGMANAHMNTFNAIREKNNLEAIAVADCWKTRADAGKEKREPNTRFLIIAKFWISKTSTTSPSPRRNTGTRK